MERQDGFVCLFHLLVRSLISGTICIFDPGFVYLSQRIAGSSNLRSATRSMVLQELLSRFVFVRSDSAVEARP